MLKEVIVGLFFM